MPRLARRPSLLRELRARCSSIRAALVDAGVVSVEEIAPVWPGGADNPSRTAEAWVYTHFNLARFSARAEARQEYTHGASPARSDALLQLQLGAPRVVALEVPLLIEGTEVSTLQLGHKSWAALRRLATYARIAVQLMVSIEKLDERPEYADVVVEAQEWRDRILRMLLWGATHPGAGLPWNVVTEPWPMAPDWVYALSVRDVITLQTAYTEQYGRALLAIAPYLQPSADEDPLTGWETFFASYATEKGIEAQQLMDARPFLPFLTQLTLAAHSARPKADDTTTPPAPVSA